MRSKYLIWIIFFFSWNCYPQDNNIIEFFLGGKDFAIKAIGEYSKPGAEALVYTMTGGWFSTASVKDPWKFQVSLISNGTLIPSRKKYFEIEINDYENLKLVGGGNTIRIPTILGGSNTQVELVATWDDKDYLITIPTGIGLLDLDLFPSAFLQGAMGLPKFSEIKIRYFPKFNIDGSKLGLIGFALQHEFSEWIGPVKRSKFSLSAFLGYSNLNAAYNFAENRTIEGDDQHVSLITDTWTASFIASTKFKVWNAFLGIGHITGNSKLHLKGEYSFKTPKRTISYLNPLSVPYNISGIRANIGGSVNIGKVFNINLDYTFQGYNNFSLGFNFNI